MRKGQPGPIKAKVHATRSKQMVRVFFNAKGIIYTYYVPRSETVELRTSTRLWLGSWLICVWEMSWFIPPLQSRNFWLLKVLRWSAILSLQRILPQQTIFYYSQRWSRGCLASLFQDRIKMSREGSLEPLQKKITAIFGRWMEHCKKCIQIGGN